jgi:hypothetical protein
MSLKCVLRYYWPWVILTIASSSKPHFHGSFATNQHRQCIDTHHEQTYNRCSCKSRTGNTDMSLKCVLRYSWPWVILTIASSSKPHFHGFFAIDYMLDYFRLHKSFTKVAPPCCEVSITYAWVTPSVVKSNQNQIHLQPINIVNVSIRIMNRHTSNRAVHVRAELETLIWVWNVSWDILDHESFSPLHPLPNHILTVRLQPINIVNVSIRIMIRHTTNRAVHVRADLETLIWVWNVSWDILDHDHESFSPLHPLPNHIFTVFLL